MKVIFLVTAFLFSVCTFGRQPLYQFKTDKFDDIQHHHDNQKVGYTWKVYDDCIVINDGTTETILDGTFDGEHIHFETTGGAIYTFTKETVTIEKNGGLLYIHYIKTNRMSTIFWFIPVFFFAVWVVYRTNVKYNSRSNKRHPSVELYRDKSRSKARWWMSRWFADHGFDETYTVEDPNTGQIDRIAPGGDSYVTLTLMEEQD